MSTESPAIAPAAGNPPAPAVAPAPSQQTTPAPAPAPAPVTPGSKAWAEMTQEQRSAQLRGPENPRARGHSPARDMREAAATRAPGDAPPSADQQQAPPADGTKIKVGKFETTESEFGAMLDRQAQDDLRKATVPPTPDAYKLALPENLTLPGGVKFQFDEAGNKATFDAAKAWAHNRGMSQSEFSEMMGLYASHTANTEAMLSARTQAEITKIGVNGPLRVDAISKWLTGMVGETDAAPIRATICTAAHVRFYEGLMNKLTSQGGASFSQSHRVPPDTAKIPGYEGMSFEQRRQAQDQLAARRNSR
jgi:hypothetical protein